MVWESLSEFVRHRLLEHPACWPALIFPLFLPVFVVLEGRQGFSRFAGRHRLQAFGWFGAFYVGLFVLNALTYLWSTAFLDLYESREASVAALLFHGGAVYPDLSSQERYATPYGPVLYVILACSQSLFAPGVFATKLPGVAAALLAVGLFWGIVRRRCDSVRAAWSLGGLEAALLLAFRQQTFWSKADPLILLLVTLGLGASLGRRWRWQIGFGLCVGLSVDLKLHALAYFLPALVMAYQTGWRWRSFLASGAVAGTVAALPFVLGGWHLSLTNLLEFLRVTAHEGFSLQAAAGYARWTLLFGALVFLSDRLVRHNRSAAPAERRGRWLFRAALALSVAVVAVPGCAVGAGQGHLLPLVPVCVLAAGDRFVRGAMARWSQSPNVFWRTTVYSSLAACGLVAWQTTWRTVDFYARSEASAQACQADIRQILLRYSDWTVLTGCGGDRDSFPAGFRHEAVFAGHPVGLDMAALMDYQQGGLPEPDLGRFSEEMRVRRQRPILWLLPRGSTPFTQTNIYERSRFVLSQRFRHDFRAMFERREQTLFYDLYFVRSVGL